MAGIPRFLPGADEALRHPHRRALLEAVRANPGAPRATLARLVGLAPTTVAHHLAALTEVGLVVPVRGARGVEHYLNGAVPPSARRPTPLPGATAARLLSGLREAGAMSLADLARAAGVSEKAAYWHLARLERARLVAAEVEGRAKRYRLPGDP
ncbi:MAG TPA: ArsR family transcriptional regulator [Candidatus Thermoplasmatota archaeon]|nr:ArsR family transcriptional regulator [Candidatus Thermoplasmatota archaeon]